MDELVYHVSPDGVLALTVVDDPHGGPCLGFHGFEWYVTGNALAEEMSCEPAEAVQRMVDATLRDERLIAVLRVDDDIDDVWITDSPSTDRQFQQEGEEIEFRFWSGRVWDG